MKIKIALSIAATLLAGVAHANDTMDAMVGAEVTYSYSDGTVVTAYYSADGTYSTDSVGGGSWTIDGDVLCIETDAGQAGCTQLEAGKAAGDSWEGLDAFGTPVTITIG